MTDPLASRHRRGRRPLRAERHHRADARVAPRDGPRSEGLDRGQRKRDDPPRAVSRKLSGLERVPRPLGPPEPRLRRRLQPRGACELGRLPPLPEQRRRAPTGGGGRDGGGSRARAARRRGRAGAPRSRAPPDPLDRPRADAAADPLRESLPAAPLPRHPVLPRTPHRLRLAPRRARTSRRSSEPS